MTTAKATVRHAVEAMQRGAVDYLMKPIAADMLETCVLHLLPRRSSPTLMPQATPPHDDNSFITDCPDVKQILETGRAVAGTRATVLITGESGTGKEVLAAFIHRHARHAPAPYIAVNCAALPETLMESELFGYEKGAFTGALNRREGKFEQAGEGTLVLDEISEMPLGLQAKLLRVLQERRIDRIGSDRQVPFNAQVIAISNRDLDELVRKGQMREDLYYRINVVPLHLPPLRERREDIPLLVNYFLTRFSALYERRAPEIDAEMMVALQNNDWKGNIRELENIIERAVLIGSWPALPGHERQGQETIAEDPTQIAIRPGLSVKAVEEALIKRTLHAVNDHRERAAQMLGISVRTLRNKLREYKQNTEELEKDSHG
jgi:DNA-binding NtrC family response regulator